MFSKGNRSNFRQSSCYFDDLMNRCLGCENVEQKRKLRHMMLINCLNVFPIDGSEKSFSIYSDPTYITILNNNCSKENFSPRHSFLEYSHATRPLEVGPCFGIVLGIVLYTIHQTGFSDKVVVSLLMQRLTPCPLDSNRGYLPLPLFKCQKHDTDKQQLQIDQIQRKYDQILDLCMRI